MSLCLQLLVSPANGVVISSGDGTGNNLPTNGPADDPGVNFVTTDSIYLGNGWYVTATHVAPAGATQIENQAGDIGTIDGNGDTVAQFADLSVYHSMSAPMTVPTYHVSCSAPMIGTEVLMVGDGFDRETDLTIWDSSWNESTSGMYSGTPEHSGFKLVVGAGTMRWGENHLTANGLGVTDGTRYTYSLETTFDLAGLTHEAQAATGDSGTAMFAKNGSDWELSGVTFAIATAFVDQPDHTAVFGNVTYAVDLSYYRDEIIQQIQMSAHPTLPPTLTCVTPVPEPRPALGMTLVFLACSLGSFFKPLSKRR